jgi:hypothetical protein
MHLFFNFNVITRILIINDFIFKNINNKNPKFQKSK